MTQFIDRIREDITSTRKYEPVQIPKLIGESEIKPHPIKHLVEVRLSVLYEQIGFCRHDEIGRMKEIFVRELRHHIYKDLKELLYQLHEHALNCDYDKCRGVIDKMHEEIEGRF